jgi:hypothetical protein
LNEQTGSGGIFKIDSLALNTKSVTYQLRRKFSVAPSALTVKKAKDLDIDSPGDHWDNLVHEIRLLSHSNLLLTCQANGLLKIFDSLTGTFLLTLMDKDPKA